MILTGDLYAAIGIFGLVLGGLIESAMSKFQLEGVAPH